jgi:hypothetical protein
MQLHRAIGWIHCLGNVQNWTYTCSSTMMCTGSTTTAKMILGDGAQTLMEADTKSNRL